MQCSQATLCWWALRKTNVIAVKTRVGKLSGDAAQPDPGPACYICDARPWRKREENGGLEIVMDGFMPEVMLIVEARGGAMVAREGVSVLSCDWKKCWLGMHVWRMSVGCLVEEIELMWIGTEQEGKRELQNATPSVSYRNARIDSTINGEET